MPGSIALLAVGGYGRGQLFPYSDIDLLVLLPGKTEVIPIRWIRHQIPPGTLGEIVVGYRLEVGHSVRTLAECIEEARKGYHRANQPAGSA